jgi:hypothetical protein
VELPLKTPSPDHVHFDDLCAEVDDFQPLPAVSSRVLEREAENGEETSLDGEILAGLVLAGY